jgi:hypothetical protein
MGKIYVDKIWLKGKKLFAQAENGVTVSYDLSQFKGFRNASPEQMQHYTILNDTSIYWPALDEDMNLEGMFYDNHQCQLTPTEDSVVFRPMLEPNESATEH